MNSDSAFEAFTRLSAEIRRNIANIQTEEDAKIQIIIRLLTDVLGWRHSDIGAERKHSTGYSDFILSDNDAPVFLLEAKRIGEMVIDTAETSKLRCLKLSGPLLSKSQDGIDQAAGYAAPNGMTVAALTDGMKWIVFKTFTPGSNFKSKDAFVFPSLDALSNDFATFYELLSKECVNKKLYNARFDEIHNNRTFLSQAPRAPIPEEEIRIQQKSDLAFDLDQIFASFFSRLTGQNDSEMLIDCFVETRESRVADLSLEKITANVLGNISPPEKDVNVELNALIENAVSVDSGQTVFIVGPMGAGKTTFLERFFRKTLSPALRRQCVVVSVNCLDSTGNEERAISWLTEVLIADLERQLYPSGSPEWDDLQGLYFAEHERRRKGVDAKLYDRDKQAFKESFGKYLAAQVEKDREGYLRRILRDVVSNRKRLPIIHIDNTDEFSAEFKRKVFQFSQAVRREVDHCIILFSVTDKSAWAFSKTDIYGIYKSKSFFLPTPPPREVFRKRVDFIRQKIKSVDAPEGQKNYFVGRGIRLSIQNIDGFAAVIEDIFVDHDYTAKTIGEISNYNIRKTLELSQRVITSTVLRIEDLLTSFTVGKLVAPNFSKFLHALLRGDYELFKQSDDHHVFSIFQVDNRIRQSPLLFLRILSLLHAQRASARNVEDKHLTVTSISNYFDSLGATEAALDCALLRLLQSGLVEAFDPSVQDLSPNQRLAIAHSGIRHLQLGLHNQVFFEQMALTTAITNHDTAEQIRNIYLSERRYPDKMAGIRKLFSEFLVREDASHLMAEVKGDQFECQGAVIDAVKKFLDSSIEYNDSRIIGSGLVKSLDGVIATVDWFDFEKGFGFVDVDGQESQAFLHADKLKEIGIDRLFDGDSLLCDIYRNAKGLFVRKVHEFLRSERIEIVSAEVIKLNPERRYGFVKLADGRRDALIHFSILSKDSLDTLRVGTSFQAEISPDKSGKSFLVRRVVSGV